MSMNAAPEIAFSSEQGKANYAAARRQYPAQAIVDLKTMRDNMAHLVSVVGGRPHSWPCPARTRMRFQVLRSCS